MVQKITLRHIYFCFLFYLAGFSCFPKFCFSLLLSFWQVFLTLVASCLLVTPVCFLFYLLFRLFHLLSFFGSFCFCSLFISVGLSFLLLFCVICSFFLLLLLLFVLFKFSFLFGFFGFCLLQFFFLRFSAQ